MRRGIENRTAEYVGLQEPPTREGALQTGASLEPLHTPIEKPPVLPSQGEVFPCPGLPESSVLEQTQISQVHTSKYVRSIEERFHMPAKQFLHQKYWIERKSQKEIGEEIGMSEEFVGDLMRRYAIPTRSESDAMNLYLQQHPQQRQRLREYGKTWWQNARPQERKRSTRGIRDIWKNPKKSEEMLAKRRSPEVKKKKSEAMREYWQTHPERVKEIGIWNRRQREQRLQEKLGATPQARKVKLENMVHNFSDEEIAEKYGISRTTVANIRKAHGVRRQRRGIGYVNEDRREIVQQARAAGIIDQLTDERLPPVLHVRYPEEGRSLSLREAAKKFSVSHEQVRKVEDRALRILEASLSQREDEQAAS